MGAPGPGLPCPWGIISYADDIKLMVCSTVGLWTAFGILEASLCPLGLGFAMQVHVDFDCSGPVVQAVLLVVLDKCSALVLGNSRASARV